MEQWEIDLRAKLNEEIPEGSFMMDIGGQITYMGKQARIEFEVLIQKEARRHNIKFKEVKLPDPNKKLSRRERRKRSRGLIDQIKNAPKELTYNNLTYEDIDKFLKDLINAKARRHK